jgi:3-isopropylmalate dehydrogenase
MRQLRVAVVPGDGIGVEVTAEAVKALTAVADSAGDSIRMTPFDWGADRYLQTGESLPAGSLEWLPREFDAILLGALGDPRVADNKHALDILLGLRFGLDLYVNHRPVRLLHERLSPLKVIGTRSEIAIDVFRENTEGPYVMMGGHLKKGTPDEVATEIDVNTRKGVERILRHAFEHARETGRKRVAMADKANVLVHAHELWRRVFGLVAAEYPEIEATAYYVDNLALQLVRDPREFQTIVTSNMFGDILTDVLAGLVGGLGVAASANLHPGRFGLFEPVHGSAPALAGKGVANPMGAILSAALLLEYAGWHDSAERVEEAVRAAVVAGDTTPDLGGTKGTREVGDAICERLAGARPGSPSPGS